MMEFFNRVLAQTLDALANEGSGSVITRTMTQVLTQPVPSIINSASQQQPRIRYGMTRTLYVLAVGVPATLAQTLTVTTPAADT